MMKIHLQDNRLTCEPLFLDTVLRIKETIILDQLVKFRHYTIYPGIIAKLRQYPTTGRLISNLITQTNKPLSTR